ncbi:MAG TPA: glycolate oxidase subunit GlcF [Steroidobacteraceae bacterium]|nr:glycolate oxidase subunit GlcF [Steroidobacteraceae bacterium]
METRLAQWVQSSAGGETADRILRACVHCGFCLATCPTYQVLGDELDSPRGRIYQIKQVLEGAAPTRSQQIHLDRCLTCRSCETTCPSGVEYGHLVDIGRSAVDERVSRPLRERAARWLLREGLTRRWLFGACLRLGRAVALVLPTLRAKVGKSRPAGPRPTQQHARKVLLLRGCTQPAMLPSIDGATSRVLDAIGIQAQVAPQAGCCGAIRHHLGDPEGALDQARRNIDAWWPYLEPAPARVEAIVVNASGCGAMIRDYAHLLRNDAAYAQKASRIVSLTRDPVEIVAPAIETLRARVRTSQRVAFQAPCTLQHGLRIRGDVESLLVGLGAELCPVGEAHMCCGSAGTYSLLQGTISRELRARKLDALQKRSPQVILSANIGCIAHLQGGTATPVRHWIEWLDEALTPRASTTS